MKRHILAKSLILLFIILALISCGKKKSEEVSNHSSTAEANHLFDHGAKGEELLAKLPSNTIFYAFVNLENPQYQSFLKSPYVKFKTGINSILNDLNEISDHSKTLSKSNLLAKFSTKFSELEGNNILSLYRQDPNRVSTYLFFVTANVANDIAYHILAYSKEQDYFLSNIEKINQDILSVGLLEDASQTAEKTTEMQKNYQFSGNDIKAHLLVDPNYMAISSNLEVAKTLFAKENLANNYDFNNSLPKQLLNNIPEQPIAFAVANFEKILQLVPAVGLINPKYKQLLNIIPRQGLIISSFDGTPTTKINLHLPETGLPANLQGALKNNSETTWETFSASTFLGFNLNLGFIKRVLNFVKTDVIDQTKPLEIKKITDLMSHLPDQGALGIALTNFNITGFPDLQVTLPINNATEKVALAKSLIASQQAAGMQASPWQQKLVEGQTVEYMVTPFGVGLYINATENLVRMGTSETALKELIKPTANLMESIQQDLNFQPENAIASFYLDYSKLYRVAQSFRSMMGMFIPPDQNTQIDSFYKKLEEFKNLAMVADSSYQNDLLEIEFKIKTITNPTQQQ